MRRLLAACWGLAWVKFSVALWITQKPRFYSMKTGAHVVFFCVSTEPSLTAKPVEWYWAPEYGKPKSTLVQPETRMDIQAGSSEKNASLVLYNLVTGDSGIYYCKINDIWGPGTELQVFKPINFKNAAYRSKMKDFLMMLQGLLLAICVAVLIIRSFTLIKREDAIYEEPEQDNIYEGLVLETCSGGIYEDISAYGNKSGAEASWQQD